MAPSPILSFFKEEIKKKGFTILTKADLPKLPVSAKELRLRTRILWQISKWGQNPSRVHVYIFANQRDETALYYWNNDLGKKIWEESYNGPGVLRETAQRFPSCSEVLATAIKTKLKVDDGRDMIAETGIVFTRNTEYPELGAAYKDPAGLIWGDVANFVNKVDFDYPYANTVGVAGMLATNPDSAAAHCKAIGARLPTVNELKRLLGYLTDSSGRFHPMEKGYINEPKVTRSFVLPLLYRVSGWAPDYTDYVYSFVEMLSSDFKYTDYYSPEYYKNNLNDRQVYLVKSASVFGPESGVAPTIDLINA